MIIPPQLHADIEAVAAQADGVLGVYRAGSLLTGVIAAGRALLGHDTQRVSVRTSDEGLEVRVAVGVRQGAAAAEVARAVHHDVADLLRERGLDATRIAVTIVHVDG